MRPSGRLSSRVEVLEDGQVSRHAVLRGKQPIDRAEAFGLWRSDPVFRAFFIDLLASAPYPAFFWETPPLTRANQAADFEFIVADSPSLAARDAEPAVFAREFAAAGRQVTAFRNLGGDALLVVPCPRAPESAYPHLAAFSRSAPDDQQHAFWQLVGEKLAGSLSERPLWLSTSGLGVAWLHVRLDSWPKYYTFEPYKRPV
ncbi:MAG: hypothetical protein QNJ67_13525 [Kiloniellales bacterium]|nr:hypothetical protein [Kiloniellales bacterium]